MTQSTQSLQPRQLLLELLASHAYQWLDTPIQLASGQMSQEYVDCKLALCHPQAVDLLGQVVLSRLDPTVATVGGLTMGADPLAMSASLASLETEHPVRWFSVRKQAKQHGLERLIEGLVQPGERCCVVDDVLTTGQSTVQAIMACQAAGLVVQQVLVLVDREENDGLATVGLYAGCRVDRIFTLDEIAAAKREMT